MGRLQNSLDLAKQSWNVLRNDKHLTLLPLLSGLSALSGYDDGPPAEMRSAGDMRVAYDLVLCCLAALLRRRETGEGMLVDLSCREVLSARIGDQLLGLQPGDAILMIAYAPLYREVTIVLEQARRSVVPVVLVSDSLGPYVADDVAVVLPVPRGKANHLAMHGGTMVLIEAIIIGLAGQDRDRALAALDRLSSLRGAIDKDWSKRGMRKSGRFHASGA